MFENVKRGGFVLVVSGPSGSGKSTLYKKALSVLGDFEFSVSCTTRAPRPGEADGVDYFFVTKERYAELLKEDAFAEHAEVHGNFYGTLKSELLRRIDAGKDILLDIDVQGAKQLRELCKRDPKFAAAFEFLFVVPPSYEVLEQRLRGRGTETEETLARRLHNAREEMANWPIYDYILVNDDLKTSIEQMIDLIRTLRLKTIRLKKETEK